MSMAVVKDLVLGYSPWGTGGGKIHPFDCVFDKGQDILKSGLEGIDALVLWGGEDIHPSYYNEPPHKHNQAGFAPSNRDRMEWKAMLYCKMHNIPIIGVCRGAQFLCAFAGGRLVQHSTGHNCGHHNIITVDGEEMNVTSAHHQMMYPWDVEHELLAWSSTKRSDKYEDGENKAIPEARNYPEPEVVYFPKVRGLGVQGHPEWMSERSRFVEWFNELIIDKLFQE